MVGALPLSPPRAPRGRPAARVGRDSWCARLADLRGRGLAPAPAPHPAGAREPDRALLLSGLSPRCGRRSRARLAPRPYHAAPVKPIAALVDFRTGPGFAVRVRQATTADAARLSALSAELGYPVS